MRGLGFASAAALGIATLALSASGGCGGDAFTSGSNQDGSTGDGSSSGGDDGMPGEAGPDGPSMMPGHTVYVAPSGKDTNTGLDALHPLRTIKKGVETAQGLADAGVMVPNVLVCTGNYPEDSLHLTFDVGLFGAYDCTTDPSNWKRAPSYGWPTFDQRVASTVTFANTTLQTATLSIGGVTTKTTVDGLSITGEEVPSSSGQSVGIEVALGASPVLSNLVVSGGSGSAGTVDAGSIGVRIGKNCNPQLFHSVIDGGSGKGPAAGSGFGSIGVRVVGGAPNIHDDVVAGGSGQSIGYSSVGIDVQSSLTIAATNPLSNMIVAGADAGGAPTGTTIGVAVRSGVQADLDIVGSAIIGSDATTGTLEAVGVEFDGGGKLNLVADRIVGGANAQGKSIGVQVTSAADASIVDCEIHGGDVPSTATGSTRGIYLTGPVAKAAIVFDTIYTGASGGQQGTAAIDVEAGVGSVTIENDLLLGNDEPFANSSAGAAVVAATCSGAASQLASLDHTGFVNFEDLLYCNDLGSSNALPAGITVAVDGPTSCKKTCGNVLVTGSCQTPGPNCQVDMACPTMPPLHCVQSILGSTFSPANDGLGASGGDAGISAAAWAIEPPGNYCKLTAGGAFIAGITDDLLGNKRSTSAPSMGAVEYMGPSCN